MFGFLEIASKLKQIGVVGLNCRNADFTLKYNKRKFYPLVDDKLKTKTLAQQAGIAVPELYGVIEIQHQIEELPKFLEPYSDFVIKPAHGSGGEGVTVISGRSKNMYRQINGVLLAEEELKHQVSNILGGMYSLGGQSDRALIEYRVRFDPVFEKVSYLGVPDIRVIVFLGVPVMAMIRLPTRMSKGKANLHQGAIGSGINLSSGKTLSAVWRNDIITEHPDTGQTVTGIEIPKWYSLLDLAVRCCELTGLSYQGVDIVLDEKLGPLILELNARPGLNIQIANRTGLLHRLRLVEEQHSNLSSREDKIRFAMERFG